jgi:cytochrome c553
MKFLAVLVPALALALAGFPAAADELADALKLNGDADRGRSAFQPCQRCHGADAGGRSDGAYPVLAAQFAPVLIKQMADIRAQRRDNPKMHPYITVRAIGVQDMADLGAFLAKLPVPQGNGRGPGTSLAQGAKLYDRNCQDCHGKQGEGDDAEPYPMLAGQHYLYLARQIREIRDGQRENANRTMRRELRGYSDADVDAVADYVSRLSPSAAAGR